ncbi:hypothetical protein WG947_06205 [Pontibacter sp. H259]|uniref:hypothetical protein n=1 Tax=Pontibacter sp. H259 TaxID=3133421 RepID=UPI0030BEB96F
MARPRNMKKKLLTLFILCSVGLSAIQAQESDTKTQQVQQAKEDKLARLMSDREQLVLEYQYLSQQNSNFWGKKSKKDLLNIIDTLKEIIRKDSELIAAVKEASIKKIAATTVESQRTGKQTVVDQRQINDRIEGLQNQITGLQNQLKKREAVVKDLEVQVKEADEKRYGKDKVITGMAILSVILLIYAITLQMKLNSAKNKVRKKKV